MRVLAKQREIASAQNKFRRAVLGDPSFKKYQRVVGFQGGNLSVTVYWSEKYSFWFTIREFDDKYWNVFGTENPEEKNYLGITCEVNIQYERTNRRIAGAFVKDHHGQVFLAHTGNIRGGQEGVGKGLFSAAYSGSWITASSFEDTEDVALIGKIDHPRFLTQLKRFIYEVQRIKTLAKELSAKDKNSIKNGFNPEFPGKKKYSLNHDVEYDSDHGLVVNTLWEELSARKFKTTNLGNIDLCILKRSRWDIIFEIKTCNDTQSLYTAIGQLYFYPVYGSQEPRKRVLVSPADTSSKFMKVKRMLKKLDIEHLEFRWSKDKPVFDDLDSVLS